jgi:hypothetical protein
MRGSVQNRRIINWVRKGGRRRRGVVIPGGLKQRIRVAVVQELGSATFFRILQDWCRSIKDLRLWLSLCRVRVKHDDGEEFRIRL